MKSALVTVSIIIFMVIIIVVFGYLYLSDLSPVYTIEEIHSKKYKESIYIKKKEWGVTGDYQVIVISKSPSKEFEPDDKYDYIYKWDADFFYKYNNDTLVVYVYKKSQIPMRFDSKITINQNELSNPEMMDLYDNYEDRGLRKLQ